MQRMKAGMISVVLALFLVLPLVGEGVWQTIVETDPITDQKQMLVGAFSTESTNRFGQPLSLVFQRAGGRYPSAAILWETYLGSERFIHVTYRIDNKEPVRHTWNASKDSTATLYAGNPTDFIRELMEAQRLVARVTPWNEGPLTAIFDLRGLREAVEDLPGFLD